MENILSAGDMFRNDSADMEFKVLETDTAGNRCRVMCFYRGRQWEEDWDDLDNVYNALETGEYRTIDHLEADEEKPAALQYFLIHDNGCRMEYCGNPEVKNRYRSYKNGGKPRMKRRK